jgi:dTDP-4-dehydrorhamnose reductase
MMDIATVQEWIPEIYNYSNEGEISWYEFVLAIQEIGGYSCEVKGIPSSILLLQNQPSFLYWIKPRLKEYMVLAFRIIKIV